MKVCCPGNEGVETCAGCNNAPDGIGDEPLAGFALDGRRIEQGERDRIDCRRHRSVPTAIGDGGQRLRAAIVGQPDRHVQEGVADLRIADVQVLIGQKSEQLVFDDGAADDSAQGVAVQLRNLVVSREQPGPG